MNYSWTDKQINQAVKRLQSNHGNSEEWLVVKDIRSGNKPDDSGNSPDAQDWRNLMSELVKIGSAFDNGKPRETNEYKISVTWKKQTEMLERLKPYMMLAGLKPFFPSKLLTSPEIINLPPREAFTDYKTSVESKLGRSLTTNDWTTWVECKADRSVVFEILCCFQTTGAFKIGSYSKSLNLSKDAQNILLMIAEEIACMYKAIETDYIHKFSEVEDLSEFAEELAIQTFFDLLINQTWSEFIQRCLLPKPSNPRTEYERLFNLIECLDEYNRNREINASKTELDKAKKRIKKKGSPQLIESVEELSDTNPSVLYLGYLLDNPIPAVTEMAQKWADAANKHYDPRIARDFFRKQYRRRKPDN